MPSLQSLCSQDAKGMFSAIKTTFSEKDLREISSNIVLLPSDGSSVNKVFRDEMPLVGFFVCFSERLELALKKALSEWMNL